MSNIRDNSANYYLENDLLLEKILLINYDENHKKYSEFPPEIDNIITKIKNSHKVNSKNKDEYYIIIVTTQDSLSGYNNKNLQTLIKNKLTKECNYQMLYKIDALRQNNRPLINGRYNVRTRIYIKEEFVDILFDKNNFKKSYKNKNSYINKRISVPLNNSQNLDKYIKINSLNSYRLTNDSQKNGTKGCGLIITNLNFKLSNNNIFSLNILNDNYWSCLSVNKNSNKAENNFRTFSTSNSETISSNLYYNAVNSIEKRINTNLNEKESINLNSNTNSNVDMKLYIDETLKNEQNQKLYNHDNYEFIICRKNKIHKFNKNNTNNISLKLGKINNSKLINLNLKNSKLFKKKKASYLINELISKNTERIQIQDIINIFSLNVTNDLHAYHKIILDKIISEKNNLANKIRQNNYLKNERNKLRI